MAAETLICDTSFVSHFLRRSQTPASYEHWEMATLDRVETARLAISVVTLAEARAGYLLANWGSLRIARAEAHLRRFAPVPVGRRYAIEWARLSTAGRRRGIAISDNGGNGESTGRDPGDV